MVLIVCRGKSKLISIFHKQVPTYLLSPLNKSFFPINLFALFSYSYCLSHSSLFTKPWIHPYLCYLCPFVPFLLLFGMFSSLPVYQASFYNCFPRSSPTHQNSQLSCQSFHITLRLFFTHHLLHFCYISVFITIPWAF